MSNQRQRVTLASTGLVIQPTPDEIAAYEPPQRGEMIAALRATADDRAEGRQRREIIVDGWRFEATIESASRAELRERALRAAAEHGAAGDATLRAQIPGRVAQVWVSEGEVVEANQRLLAIEAMKMENEIRAPHAGTVKGLRVETGARVERDAELLTIAGT